MSDKLRKNVLGVIFDDERNVLIVSRSNDPLHWQFPQGGIDEGEEVLEALFREMLEEIGTDKAEIVGEYPEWLSYDFPEKIARNMKPYKGQTQRYFLVKLHKEAEINLDTKHPEFMSYKFVDVETLLDYTAHFKKPVYETVVNYFKNEGLL